MKIEQTYLVTSILDEINRQHPRIVLPAHKVDAVIKSANALIRALEADTIETAPGEGVDAWRKSDNVGLSSNFMANILDEPGYGSYAHPKSVGDFYRCLSLLEAAPELRGRLPQIARQSYQWELLVENWDTLETMYIEADTDDSSFEELADELHRISVAVR